MLADKKPKLHEFRSHGRHDEQNEQNESQRGDGAVQQQLRLGKALLLKQGHVVGEIVGLLPFIGL